MKESEKQIIKKISERIKRVADDIEEVVIPYGLNTLDLNREVVEEILKMMAQCKYVDELLTNLQRDKHCDRKNKTKPKKAVRKKSSARSTKQKSR